ncbi:FG-GAP repeat domain-containing protein [Streptomyces sp. NPDC056503]|uniref:FG-GAP repeat domain-containing protein n=1 Tax=Streptomyces sp. NPDC056503 TaxID=3345842 RepID=UPI0036BC31F5
MHVHHPRKTRLRLAAAVTTALAMTLSGAALAVPAQAAPVAAGLAGNDVKVVPFPGAELTDAGLTGFLTRPERNLSRTYTRFVDGATFEYDDDRVQLRSSLSTDYLVQRSSGKVTVTDLGDSAVFEVPLRWGAGQVPDYVGAAADCVFTTTTTSAGTQFEQHSAARGTVAVTGLPAGATDLAVVPGTPQEAIVTFTAGGKPAWGLIDLADGTVGEVRYRAVDGGRGALAVSATHAAWTERAGIQTATLFLLDRATGKVKQLPLPDGGTTHEPHLGLVGDWVVYGEADRLEDALENPLHGLTAYHPVTGERVRLIDHLTSAASAPDALYASGGTVAGGQGAFKITVNAAGRPVVTQVAADGQPITVAITGHNVPAVIDFEQNDGVARLRWDVSREAVEIRATLRHQRTGKTQTKSVSYPYMPHLALDWEGDIGYQDEAAPNGAYTWEVTARPLNGIGPAAVAKGSFTVVRSVQPHDFDDNGSPDLLTTDATGRLWRSDTFYTRRWNRPEQLQAGADKALIGGGWQVYDRIETVGNVAGSRVGDIVARDKTGVLWLYQGNGLGGFAGRIRIGGGWQTYEQLAGGSDLTGDGRPDLLATDRTGTLWLYRGTGNTPAPFASRVKVGGGWGIYNELTVPGDLGGAPSGDLIARDKTGVLWLYLGRGDGTFTTRQQIGGGWQTYTHLAGMGDADGDGRPDLLGLSAKNGVWLYRSTGERHAPFQSRQATTELTAPANATLPAT